MPSASGAGRASWRQLSRKGGASIVLSMTRLPPRDAYGIGRFPSIVFGFIAENRQTPRFRRSLEIIAPMAARQFARLALALSLSFAAAAAAAAQIPPLRNIITPHRAVYESRLRTRRRGLAFRAPRGGWSSK